MPKQINTFEPGRSLVQRFGLKGRFQPVLDEVVVPVVVVEPASRSDKPASIWVGNIPAAAGRNAFLNIANPADSGVRIVLEGFSANAGANCAAFVSILPATLVGAVTTAAVARWRDTGLPGVPGATIVAGHQLTASLPATAQFFWRAEVSQTTIRVQPGDGWFLIIQPGDEATVWCDTVNVAWGYSSLLWREETINPTDQ